jgi:hypothetical protein
LTQPIGAEARLEGYRDSMALEDYLV